MRYTFTLAGAGGGWRGLAGAGGGAMRRSSEPSPRPDQPAPPPSHFPSFPLSPPHAPLAQYLSQFPL